MHCLEKFVHAKVWLKLIIRWLVHASRKPFHSRTAVSTEINFSMQEQAIEKLVLNKLSKPEIRQLLQRE